MKKSRCLQEFASKEFTVYIFNRYAAEELSTELYLRGRLKTLFRDKGYLTTVPTDRGQKDLDVFHPSYRVKRITQRPLHDLLTEEEDLYIEAERCAEQGLIILKVEVSPEDLAEFN